MTQTVTKRSHPFDRGARFIKKSRGVLCQGAAVKYAWIREHSTDFPVTRLCRLMDTSRSAYYGWLHRSPTTTEKEDRELTEIIG